MTANAASAMLRIRVVLPATAASAATGADLVSLAASLRAEVNGLAARLGVPLGAGPEIVIDREASEEAQPAAPAGDPVLAPRVEVDGQPPVIPPANALLRAAYALSPSPVRDAILRRAVEAGSLAGASQAVAQALASQSTQERELALALIAVELVAATFRRQPSLLVTDHTAQQWLAAVDPGYARAPSWDPRAFLSGLLDAGLTARLDPGDRATLRAAAGCGSAEEAVQWLISRAVSQPSLVLRLHPGVLAELTGAPVDPGARLSLDDPRIPGGLKDWPAVAAAISATTAVLVPALYLDAAADLPPGTVQVSLLARRLEPVPVPRTEVDRQVLERLPVFSGPVRVPAPPDRATGSPPESWLSGLLSRIVTAEVMNGVHLLLDMEQVAYRTSQVEDDDPELTNLVLDRMPSAQLTLLLRRLVAEGLYPTNLQQVFEVIAEADWLPVGTPGLRALDPRPLVPAGGRNAAGWHRTLAALRHSMTGQLREVDTARSSGVGGYLTSAVTQALESAWLAGAQDCVDEEVARLAWQAETSDRPVLVASDLARPLAAQSLTVRESAIRVLSETEAAAAGLSDMSKK